MLPDNPWAVIQFDGENQVFSVISPGDSLVCSIDVYSVNASLI